MPNAKRLVILDLGFSLQPVVKAAARRVALLFRGISAVSAVVGGMAHRAESGHSCLGKSDFQA